MKVTIEYEPGELSKAEQVIDANMAIVRKEGEYQTIRIKITDRVRAERFMETLLCKDENSLKDAGIEVKEIHFNDTSTTNMDELAEELVSVIGKRTGRSYTIVR